MVRVSPSSSSPSPEIFPRLKKTVLLLIVNVEGWKNILSPYFPHILKVNVTLPIITFKVAAAAYFIYLHL
ncbi:unnamed protein product [Allacma fusca]|uniref:Uncharacterized protein n=1 Tax=Allacma fusca TaxID=39272 RepID=A0A8J2NK90_9HEXA|nr:unnamed protein product [Allacma fusca]